MSVNSLSTFQSGDLRVEFLHAFQPIVDVSSRCIYAYEALLRSPSGQGPVDVIRSVPKQYYSALDQTIRETALARASALGVSCRLSLNMSSSCMIQDQNYLLKTIDYAEQCGIAAQNVVIEISESDVIHGIPRLNDRLNEAHARGALIALDDFGAGYAGLNSLIDVNPDIIKLDMYLIRNIDSSGPRQATIKALVGLALDLGIDLIAEGVETAEEYAFLTRAGIDMFQGYFFAKPQLCQLVGMDDVNY